MAERNIDRVEAHTSAASNEQIERRKKGHLGYFAQCPEEIPARLRELEREWDVERVLETGSSTLSLMGLLFTITRSRGWILLPLAVQSFFLQHAIQGWCPPLPLIRKLGVRTMREILEERAALIGMLAEYRGRPQPTRPLVGGPPLRQQAPAGAMGQPG